MKLMKLNYYQLDFVIPGISPRLANSRKHILHNLKSLIYPLFLPQRQHLRTVLVLYFGFLLDFTICPVVAIFSFVSFLASLAF